MNNIFYKTVSLVIIIMAITIAGLYSRKAMNLEFSGSVSELVVVEKSSSPLEDESIMKDDEQIIITFSSDKLFTVEGIKDLEKITEILGKYKLDDSKGKPDLKKEKFLISVLSVANSAIPRHRPYTERNVDRKNLIGCVYAIKLTEDTYKKYLGSDICRILFDIHNSPVFPNFPDKGLEKAVEYLSEDTFWLRAPENRYELMEFKDDINHSLFRRNLISTDFKTAAVYLRVAPELESEMHRIISKVKKAITPYAKDYNIEFAGYPILKEEVRKSIILDCRMFAILALIFWTIAFWTVFRTLRGIILPLINLIISELCLLGIMADLGFKLNAVLFIVPVFLVAVGSSGSIHMMTRFYQGIRKKIPHVRASLEAVKEVLLPLFSAALTTAFGFAMLMISNVKGLNQFAMLCIIGLGLNTLGTLLVIPSFNILLPAPKKIKISKESTNVRWRIFVKWIVKRRMVIIPVFIILSLISLSGINYIIADNDLTRLLDRNSQALKTMKKLSRKLGGATIIKLDIKGEPGSVIRKSSLAKMRLLQKKITEIEGVDKCMSMVDLFDLFYSLRTYPALEKVSEFKDQWIINSHVHFLEMLKERDAFRKHSAAIDSMLRIFSSMDYSISVMTIQSSDMSLIELNRIRDSILVEAGKLFKSPFSISLRGEMLSINRAVERVIKGQTNGVIWSLSAVFFIMLLIFLSIKVAVIAIIPNIIPILFFYGYLGFSGIGLDLSSGLIACVAIGISVDNSIYFMTEMKRNLRKSYNTVTAMTRSAITVGSSMFAASTVLAFLFGVLWFSRFQVFSNLGFLQSQTMLICLVGNLILLPALLTTFQIVPVWEVITNISSKSLDQCALLDDMNWFSRRVVISLGKLIEIKKAQDITLPGKKIDSMFMIIKGTVKIKADNMPLHILTPGNVFYEETLIGESTPEKFNVYTSTDVTLLEISNRLFDQAGWLYPITCGKLAKNIMNIKTHKSSLLDDPISKEGKSV